MSSNGASPLLPLERLNRLENFGHSIHSPGYLYRPTQVEEVEALFDTSRKQGLTIALRGSGRSYGDAALNSGGIVLNFQRMNRILEWDPETGVIKVEPGVTIEQLWKYTLEDGWWSPVVPGTMFPTLGGVLAANVHGKNNWRAGTLGEHVLEFEAMLPNGKQVTCTPKKNKDLFYGLIGGMGMLGVFTSITLQMKKVYSGYLEVKAWVEPTLERMLAAIDENKEEDYNVGWVDCTAFGKRLGRGQMHTARYLEPGEDPNPAHSLSIGAQVLPDTMFGIVPKSIVHQFLRLGMNNLGAWGGNLGKYTLNRVLEHHKVDRWTFTEFSFLLDYVPNWERSYGSGGLIQYQSFLPKETAYDSYLQILRLSKRRGLPSYLGVLKRHRPDAFLLSHAVDGFSLALDYKVTRRNVARLRQLTADLNQIVLEGRGRFYFAKDSTLTPDVVRAFLGEETTNKFQKLKKKVDPQNVLQTDLYKRCFG